ncbi:unnamed protein product, partial [Ascophyllum nodosum]
KSFVQDFYISTRLQGGLRDHVRFSFIQRSQRYSLFKERLSLDSRTPVSSRSDGGEHFNLCLAWKSRRDQQAIGLPTLALHHALTRRPRRTTLKNSTLPLSRI